MNEVITKFVDELKARIDLIKSTDDNLDSSKVDQIKSIIDKYEILDTSTFSDEDINTILDLLKLTSRDNLDNNIKDYLNGYDTVLSTHTNTNNETINTYNKYIDILTNGTDETFEYFDELDELMAELGLMIDDKWQIISYFNELNIKNNISKIEILNLNSKLNTYNKLYLNNTPLKEYVEEGIKDIILDIDMIPSLSKKLTNGTYDEDTIKNALCVIVLNEIYKSLNNTTDKNELDNLQYMINKTLKYIDNYEETIIDPIKDIVVNYEDLLNEEINKGNDINSYVDISIDDLEKLVGDHDKALKLKRLPLIKSMRDTLNSIDECDKSSEDMINYLDLLSDLNKLYNETN